MLRKQLRVYTIFWKDSCVKRFCVTIFPTKVNNVVIFALLTQGREKILSVKSVPTVGIEPSNLGLWEILYQLCVLAAKLD